MVILSQNEDPIGNIDEWFALAPPKRGSKHWVIGRSAYQCARAWCCCPDTPGVPDELVDLLESHPDTKGAKVSLAIPEHSVRFDTLGGEPRNSDVDAIADHPKGCISLSIEAKADECFGKLVCDQLQAAHARSVAGRHTKVMLRVKQLEESLLPPPAPGTALVENLRYQLLTGAAGALAFAIDTQATRAIFIVHEFVTNRTCDRNHARNECDLNMFVARLTQGKELSLSPGTLIGPLPIPGSPLFNNALPFFYMGKVQRNLR